MRVTHNSVFIPYRRNLEEIQDRRVAENMRLSTGKRIINISDDPGDMVEIKQLTSVIDKNDNYIDIIDETLAEMSRSQQSLEAISDKMQQVRQLSIDATQTGNLGNLTTLGGYVKGLLRDMVRISNTDFNGKYLFSGTKTRADSLDMTPPATDVHPFELVEETPTEDNPSGLRVIFKGNNENRIINKDTKTTETINTTAADAFGGDGAEMFDTVIGIYNLLMYDQENVPRNDYSVFNKADVAELNKLQKDLASRIDSVNTSSSKNGTIMNRLDSMRLLIVESNTRMKEYRSISQDTDVTKSALELAKEENALQYSLNVGARLIQNSLFDFLR